VPGLDQSANQVTSDEPVGPGHQYPHEERLFTGARAIA
jgi:hypothetical protein